jgi:hypothetical protein
MSPYHWSASQQVVERLLQVRGSRQRLKLTDFFDRLVADPELLSEGHFADEEGNAYHLAVYERWLITYHVDHATKKVNVLALEV